MTASVASFLSQAQKKGTQLPPALSGALLLAAVRLSEKKMQAVRAYQLLVDDDGALDLLTGEPPIGDGYAAPELRNGAVLPEDPRVLVYAVGALGYELLTLTPPPRAGQGKAEEVTGPLAPVIRKAMSDRQQRYKSLADMARAIERIQGRPSREEERLILAAVAASTPLPVAQKLAKIELGRVVAPEDASQAPAPPDPQPVFTQVWDPLEAQAQPAAAPAPPEHPPEPAVAPDSMRAELEAERRARRELSAAIESRIQDLAQLGTRLSLLEEQVRSSLPPPLSPAASLAREVKELLEQRRFAEAERALLDPRVQNDAVLQFALGQALSSMPDPDGSLLSRAEAAFRRAVDLDATWAEPRTRLGVLLWRKGKQSEARTQLQAALKLDPASPEAVALLSLPRPRASAFAVSAGVSALAAAAVILAFRPWRSFPPPDRGPTLASTSVAPALQLPPLPPPPAATRAPPTVAPAAPAPAGIPAPDPPAAPAPKAQTRPPNREPEPEPREPPAPRPEARKKKVASVPGNRAAAEAEAARGDKSLRAFDTRGAETAFTAALKLDPTLPSAHRGMGMVYVLLGRNAEAKAAYSRYLQLAPDAPDKEQIARLLAR